MEKHRKALDSLAGKCKGIANDPEVHDDIFFLRYILSYGDTPEAVEAIKFTVEWRRKPENLYLLSKVEDVEKGAKGSFFFFFFHFLFVFRFCSFCGRIFAGLRNFPSGKSVRECVPMVVGIFNGRSIFSIFPLNFCLLAAHCKISTLKTRQRRV